MKKFIFKAKRGSRWVLALTGFIASVFILSCNQGPPKGSRAAQAKIGKEHFMNYCSSCHGEDGKGLNMDELSKQPLDLTRIVVDRKITEFPILEIANIIDGRKMVEPHGSRDMPIWGEVFSTGEYLKEEEIKGRLAEIIAYLMSIQESSL